MWETFPTVQIAGSVVSLTVMQFSHPYPGCERSEFWFFRSRHDKDAIALPRLDAQIFPKDVPHPFVGHRRAVIGTAFPIEPLSNVSDWNARRIGSSKRVNESGK